MDQKEQREKAVAYKHNGCNCCQAVMMAFGEETGLPENLLKKLGASYGVGMGCMGATCGSLIGAEMLLGLKEYEGRPILGRAKKLYGEFERLSGATLCSELKGLVTGKVLCECDDCVRNAVEAFQKMTES